MQYYGTRLSENISRRDPEGYLLCLNVPVARTGVQEYLPEELGLTQESPLPIPVLRPESEVFSAETVASFEGMPVTNDHPPDGVTVENIRALQKGHAHNVRRGSGNESDLLLADLIITDETLIDAILAGKREISCGYTYELCEENGVFIQRQIRGNHVAVVDAGRAGPRVSIRDHKPERRKTVMKKSLLKKLTCMAKDGDPEAIEALAEMAEQIVDPGNVEAAVAVSAAPEPESPAPVAPAEEPAAAHVPEEGGEARDEDILAEIARKLDRPIELLTPAAADGEPDPENPDALTGAQVEQVVSEIVESGMENGEDPESVARTVAEVITPEPSAVIGPEDETDCGRPLVSGDALRAVLKPLRPVLKRMTPAERVKVCSDIAAGMKRIGDSRAYAGMISASRPQESPADLGRRIMSARNVNCK